MTTKLSATADNVEEQINFDTSTSSTSMMYNKLSFGTGTSTCRLKKSLLLWTFFYIIGNFLVASAGSLPEDFKVQGGSSGPELVWTANDKTKVRVGGSRPEFRITSGTVIGFPREDGAAGTLVLPITNRIADQLETDGQHLEVWSSGRRIDDQASDQISATTTGPTKIAKTPTVPVDPTITGNYSISRISYKLPGLNYSIFPNSIEVLAEVTYPVPFPSKTKCPLILFLHGRHATCYQGGPDGSSTGDWPCSNGYLPIPSHLGYRYVADILASNGYIAVSISANGVNGQDGFAVDGGATARSILIRHHLSIWSKWNTVGGDPWQNKFLGKVQLDKVVLVGHSRGGEGINKAAIDVSSLDPYSIVGLVSYGPTAFSQQVTPDVHSATILPSCDGDVSDLQGQAYIDRSRDIAYTEALRSAVISVGSNHNYFNTEWTPGLSQAPANDDWWDNDLVCGATNGKYRLTPQEQQVVGAAYTIALVRLAVYQDSVMLQFLDGSYVKPAIVGRAEIATHAVGGVAHRFLYLPEKGRVVATRGMVQSKCKGYDDRFSKLPQCTSSGEFFESPHFISSYILPTPQAMQLQWSRSPNATAWFLVPTDLRNLTGLDTIDFRIANNPKSSTGARMRVFIQDGAGRNATLRTSMSSIDSWPQAGYSSRLHARALRATISSAQNVDLSNIAFVGLVAQSQIGLVWVLDIAAVQRKVNQVVNLDLPVVSAQTGANVSEGNGPKTVGLNITTNKPLKSAGAIWCTVSLNYNYLKSFKINIAAGKSGVIGQVPISLEDDNLFSTDVQQYSVSIGSVKGVVIGETYGSLVVIDDDVPTFSVKTQTFAVEGSNLVWTFDLSIPTVGLSIGCDVIPPVSAPELTSDDVPSKWLQSLYVTKPATPTPLSALDIYGIGATIPYGFKSASILIPTIVDKLKEGNETISLRCSTFSRLSLSWTLVGTVLASK